MRIELAGGQRRIPLGTDGRPETGSVPGAEITGRFLGSETAGRSPEAEITGRFPGLETSGRSPGAEITGRFPGTEITEWAPGIEITEWAPGTGSRFHAVYAAAFRERPGFPDPPAAEWIEETAEEDDFRADWSLLATVPGIGDAGFVTATEGWIVQVGVVPAARGTGLGAALIRESLRRAAAAGFGESWLCVNADNPAANLYRRLGFQHRGRRARYRRSPA
ncbi:GNAT family N-acetyltransferase [Actinoplanes sp. G11-F43]|uniref:GNAT family N-acetyltransferase n=1 Tax=Actinoplanes sp. G11-F43 TaxID=3424130 RepID=UPI003D32CD70